MTTDGPIIGQWWANACSDCRSLDTTVLELQRPATALLNGRTIFHCLCSFVIKSLAWTPFRSSTNAGSFLRKKFHPSSCYCCYVAAVGCRMRPAFEQTFFGGTMCVRNWIRRTHAETDTCTQTHRHTDVSSKPTARRQRPGVPSSTTSCSVPS